MSDHSTYALDANVFIEAHRRYYAFDLCPGFWESLIWHHEAGRIWSIDRVKDELERGNDHLAQWVGREMPEGCFASTDDNEVVNWYSKMVAWVQGEPQFVPEAKAEFAQKADAWLIAYAKAKGLVLVTHEIISKEIKRKVPIPNVCQKFNVEFVDSFEMLRALTVQFSWHPAL
jgi:hypothetical protein